VGIWLSRHQIQIAMVTTGSLEVALILHLVPIWNLEKIGTLLVTKWCSTPKVGAGRVLLRLTTCENCPTTRRKHSGTRVAAKECC
jgi:hypothetical protein